MALLAALSEPALRLLLARAWQLPDAARPGLLVELARRPSSSSERETMENEDDEEEDAAPRLHGNGTLKLPRACPNAEAFTARVLRALDLQEAAAADA